MSEIAKTLDYRMSSKSSSSYQEVLVPSVTPYSGPQINALTNVQFDLPNTVFNLSRSKIRWTLQLPAQGASQLGAVWTNRPPIFSIVLRSRNGRKLCEIENFDKYWVQTAGPNADEKDFCTRGIPLTAASRALALTQEYCSFLNPSGELFSSVATDSSGSARVNNAGASDATTRLKSYQAQNQYIQGPANTARFIGMEIRLGDIAHSIWSVDRSLYSPDQLTIEIRWQQGNAFGFVATDNALANQGPLLVTPIITDLVMLLATERNQKARSQIMELVMTQGLKMVIPYPTVSTYALGTSTSTAVQHRVGRSFGSTLLRIYSSEYNTANAGTLHSNFNNIAGSKTSSFNTQLNGQRLQDDNLNVAESLQWQYISRLLEGSAVTSMNDHMSMGAAFIDDWSAVRQSLPDAKDDDMILSGLPLNDVDQVYTRNILTKSATDTTCCVSTIAQRALLISREGTDIST